MTTPNPDAIGLFANASSFSVPSGTDRVQTSGYGQVGQGAAAYIADSAVNSTYVSNHPRSAFLDANGRGFRLDPEQRLTIQMFGGKPDGVAHRTIGAYSGTAGATDNAPALNAALALVRANVLDNGSGTINYYRASAEVHFPAADGVYDFQSSVSIDTSVKLTGVSGPGAGVGGSILRWLPGMHGLIIQYAGYTWSGASTDTSTPTSFGGGSTMIDGLSLYQFRDNNNYETEDYHGIFALAAVTVRNFVCSGWSGAGIYGLGGVPNSNVNNCFVENGSCYGNEHGIWVDGGDSNVWTVTRVDSSLNRGYGFFDSSFLGNTWIGCHTDGNGIAGSGAGGTVASMCSYSGKLYYVRGNQAAAASTHAPSGTTADNSWWGYIGAGGPDTAHPAWVSGTTFREGGAYRTDAVGAARSLFLGCYAEGTNAASYFVYPTFVISGLMNNPMENYYASVFDNSLGLTTLTTPLGVKDSLRVDGTIVVGPRQAAIADDTSGAANQAKVNAILAMLRAHGLIAP